MFLKFNFSCSIKKKCESRFFENTIEKIFFRKVVGKFTVLLSKCFLEKSKQLCERDDCLECFRRIWNINNKKTSLFKKNSPN